VIYAIVLVFPGVAVRIEMQQGQWATVFAYVRFEQRIGNEVVATE
jgi:hypothetical protein